MTEELKIPQTFRLITEEVRKNACAFVSGVKCGEGYIVTIKHEKEARSAAQSRLRWQWMGQLEKELAGTGKGRTKDEWNVLFKKKFMRRLLIEQDEDWKIFFDDYQDTCDLLAGQPAILEKYQWQFWESIAKTEEMNVKTFSEWLDIIDRVASEKLGVLLVTPEDLKWSRGND